MNDPLIRKAMFAHTVCWHGSPRLPGLPQPVSPVANTRRETGWLRTLHQGLVPPPPQFPL